MVLSFILLISLFLASSSVAKAAECKHNDDDCKNNDECCSKSCLGDQCSPSQTEGTVCSMQHEHDCAVATGYKCIEGKCHFVGECTLFGRKCDNSYECCSNRCNMGERKCKCAETTGKPCDENEDCCKPLVCINEKCKKCLKSGTQCGKESECCSNKCVGGKCSCSNINGVCLSTNDCCKANAGQLEVVCDNGKCQKCKVSKVLSKHSETREGECSAAIKKETCCTKKCAADNFCTYLADGANCEINANCDSGNCWKGKCVHVAYGEDKNCFKENENCPDKTTGKGACCGKFVCEGGKCIFRKNISCDNPGACNPGVDMHGGQKQDPSTQYQQQSTIG